MKKRKENCCSDVFVMFCSSLPIIKGIEVEELFVSKLVKREELWNFKELWHFIGM